MSDPNAWAQPGWRSGAHNALSQELNRAGLDQRVDAKSLANALIAGSPFAQKKVKSLIELGNPDSAPDTTGQTFGVPNAEIQANQFQNQIGRGWTQQEMDSLDPNRERSDYWGSWYALQAGPNPKGPTPRELSKGGRQADEQANRREFLSALIDESPKSGLGPRGSDLAAMSGSSRNAAESAKEGSYQDYIGKVGRTHGTSGYAGAMSNPEYGAGYAMTQFLDHMPNAIKYGLREPGAVAGDVIHSGLPKASALAKFQLNAGRVEPQLMTDSSDPLEKEQEFLGIKRDLETSQPMAYRDWYRHENGQWPSYARENLAEFRTNMMDYTLPLTFMGAMSKGLTLPARAARMAQEGYEELGPHAVASALLAPPPANIFRGGDARTDLEKMTPDEFSDYYNKQNSARRDFFLRQGIR